MYAYIFIVLENEGSEMNVCFLCLSYSDSSSRFMCKVKRALAFRSMRKFLNKGIMVDELIETRVLRVRTK